MKNVSLRATHAGCKKWQVCCSELVEVLLNFVVYRWSTNCQWLIIKSTLKKWQAITPTCLFYLSFHHSVLGRDGARKCRVNIWNTDKKNKTTTTTVKGDCEATARKNLTGLPFNSTIEIEKKKTEKNVAVKAY